MSSFIQKFQSKSTPPQAFVCDACGRRFGVNSNLNRHMKRCQLRNPSVSPEEEPNEDADAAGDNDPIIPKSLVGYDLPSARTNEVPKAVPKKRQSISSSTSPSTADVGSTGVSPIPSQTSPKRRRRPTSPIQWVPASLLGFKLFPIEFAISTPVPLPPVTAYQDPHTSEWIEERDSYDENVGANPYHPKDWKGKLPGPGLAFGGKDVRNLDVTGYGRRDGYFMGRLILT